jgi:hypothetical protein
MSNPNPRNEDIDKEVAHMLKKNKSKSTYDLMTDLKKKYGDQEIVNSIISKYNSELKRIKNLADKIKERLQRKHPNYTHKQYIDKINEYKEKHNLSDSEVQTIINLIFMNKSGFTGEVDNNVLNEMSKALGFQPVSHNLSSDLQVKKDEKEYFDAIRMIAAQTKELHNQVVIDSFVYDGAKIDFKNTLFERSKINLFSFVHPVVAALFLPKIDLLEKHMLFASIAEIIDQKAEGYDIKTQPEYELYYDIATDPAETACVKKSKPFADLLDRCNVQTKLWESVLHLRQNKYYMNDLTSFILAIDRCKASVFDAADLAYVKDEGTILRKLFAVFSLRPTINIVVPRQIFGMSSNIADVTTSHISTLSMITMRIPTTTSLIGVTASPGSISIADHLKSTPQLYIHHNKISVKDQQVIFSREIIVFYAHRRYQELNFARLSKPYEIASLPITMSQFEKLQDSEIVIAPLITIDSKVVSTAEAEFKLISIVAVETKPTTIGTIPTDIIISSSSYVHVEGVTAADDWLHYNPLDLGSNKDVKPITSIPYANVEAAAKKRGTIFIYKAIPPKTKTT